MSCSLVAPGAIGWFPKCQPGRQHGGCRPGVFSPRQSGSGQNCPEPNGMQSRAGFVVGFGFITGGNISTSVFLLCHRLCPQDLAALPWPGGRKSTKLHPEARHGGDRRSKKRSCRQNGDLNKSAPRFTEDTAQKIGCAALARRKEIYEALHPETKRGGAPGAGRGKKKRSQDRQNDALVSDSVPSFTQDTAQKIGCAALARRKEIYEALHPETRHGGAGRGRPKKSPQNEDSNAPTPSFTQDTARQTGRTPRSVQRDVAIGRAIPDDVAEAIASTPRAYSQSSQNESFVSDPVPPCLYRMACSSPSAARCCVVRGWAAKGVDPSHKRSTRGG